MHKTALTILYHLTFEFFATQLASKLYTERLYDVPSMGSPLPSAQKNPLTGMKKTVQLSLHRLINQTFY